MSLKKDVQKTLADQEIADANNWNEAQKRVASKAEARVAAEANLIVMQEMLKPLLEEARQDGLQIITSVEDSALLLKLVHPRILKSLGYKGYKAQTDFTVESGQNFIPLSFEEKSYHRHGKTDFYNEVISLSIFIERPVFEDKKPNAITTAINKGRAVIFGDKPVNQAPEQVQVRDYHMLISLIPGVKGKNPWAMANHSNFTAEPYLPILMQAKAINPKAIVFESAEECAKGLREVFVEFLVKFERYETISAQIRGNKGKA